MTTTIYKQLGSMEDLAAGVGTVAQSRNGAPVTVHKVDVPFAVNSIAEMQALPITQYTSCRVYLTSTSFEDYRYSQTSTNGYSSVSLGTWVRTGLSVVTDVVNLKAAKVDWADCLGRKVSVVVNNTTSNSGGAEYVIANVNPGNLSTLVGGIWVGANHDLGGGFYAKLLTFDDLNIFQFGGVADYDYIGETGTDNTAVVQSLFDAAFDISQRSGADAEEPLETNYKTTSRIEINCGKGSFYVGGQVNIPAPASGTSLRSNISLIGTGVAFSGQRTNSFLNYQGSANKNSFTNITFSKFLKAIILNTTNKNESMFVMNQCQSMGNDEFVDTVGYTSSRSTMMTFNECTFSDTRRVLTHYTDHATFNNCWIYRKYADATAPFYLSGDGLVSFNSCFFIPHGAQTLPKEQVRFIDFVCDPAQSLEGDRSVKSLTIKSCRFSLESASGFIWTYDLNGTDQPDGQRNQYSTITIEDTYVGGLGGLPAVIYKQGWPGGVNFRNTKFFAGSLCAIDAGNTQPPLPSNPDSAYGFLSHTITVDEATRATMGFSGNDILPLNLRPYLYDSTSQTSKYKRSIRANIDYRLKSVAAPGAGANFVKVSIPIYFDKTRTANTPCRDILSFMVTIYSDAAGQSLSVPVYAASATAIVTVIGGNASSVTARRIIVTPLQNAAGAISYTSSVMPTAHWGTGDTGSADISVLTGDEDNITLVWGNTPNPALGFAYILPLAGSRNNYFGASYQQGVW